MKVGTDGILLGVWAPVAGPGSRVLDVGTGTGLIALMIAQRTRDVWLDALEIDPSSAFFLCFFENIFEGEKSCQALRQPEFEGYIQRLCFTDEESTCP